MYYRRKAGTVEHNHRSTINWTLCFESDFPGCFYFIWLGLSVLSDTFEVWLIIFLLKTFKLQQKILNQSKLSFGLLNCCKRFWISQSCVKVQFQRLPRFSSHISPPSVRSLVTSFQASVSNAFLVYQCTEYHFPFRKKVKTWVDIWRCNKKLNMCNILYPNWSRSCLTYSWPDQFYTSWSFLPQSAMANDMTWQIWKGKLHVSFKWVMGQVWTAHVLKWSH